MASIRTASIAGLVLLSAVSLAGCAPSSGGAAPSSAAPASSATASASPVSVPSASTAPAGSGGSAATSVQKACDLVTAAEFGSAVGATVAASDHLIGVYDSCVYQAGSTSTGAILVRPFTRSDFEKSVAAAPGTKTPVAGAGEAADTEVVKGLTVLVAWHAGVEVSVELHGADALAKEKAVADTAFAKLG